MPSILLTLRLRSKRKRHTGPASKWGKLLAGAAAALLITTLTLLFITVLLITSLAEDLQPVSNITINFSPGDDFFKPATILDRDGVPLIPSVLHPDAFPREYLVLNDALSGHAANATISTMIALIDPTFWENPGWDFQTTVQLLRESLNGNYTMGEGFSITQRLALQALIPGDEYANSSSEIILKSTILAHRMSSEFSKEQILEWYLNNADFGQLAYGLDAAARVYYGEPIDTLGGREGLILAARLPHTWKDPWTEALPPELLFQEAQDALENQGIEPSQFLDSGTRFPENQLDRDLGLLGRTWRRLEKIIDLVPTRQPGLIVKTTIDSRIQEQAVCAGLSQLGRLQGKSPDFIQTGVNGKPCDAAELLAPPDAVHSNLDHGVNGLAIMVSNPASGEILSIYGDVDRSHPAGTMLYPFVYLTDFSRGSSPATMIIDVPLPELLSEDSDGELIGSGPVSTRTAMIADLEHAARRTLVRIGPENVFLTSRQMGIMSLQAQGRQAGAQLIDGTQPVSLGELISSYGIFANQGRMIGIQEPAIGGGISKNLSLVLITEVQDVSSNILYQRQMSEKVILGSSLNYLLTDVLSDDAAREKVYGRPNLLEIGRPVGVKISTPADTGSWAVGFTPSLAVGIWIGNNTLPLREKVDAMNSTAPVWRAVTQFVLQDQPPSGWKLPAGVNTVEVCNPSGLLPTDHCPDVNREIFLEGTEPVYFDNLFQPYRVNRETGKLATLNTPENLVEERVYLIPPPDAVAWAENTGIANPPDEYEPWNGLLVKDTSVEIQTPTSFSYIAGEVDIIGTATGENFLYYRLQYGQGLNPSGWILLGEDVSRPRVNEELARWNVAGLEGLYTLQLMVVKSDSQISTSSIPLLIDNQEPQVRVLLPSKDQVFTLNDQVALRVQVEVVETMAFDRLEIIIDHRIVATLTQPPFSYRWPIHGKGEHQLVIRAYDTAGNQFESEIIPFIVE
jgi:membrane carboxypeptidase/penicillin-binding protein